MMEEQIISAIQIAWDPAADQTLKRQAFDYVNRLRQEPAAWHPCLLIFISLPRHPDIVRLFSLEIVNNAIQMGMVETAGLVTVKNQLLAYLQQEYGPGSSDEAVRPPDSATIENKIAQTITYLFCILYETGWETFFDDLLGLTKGQTGQRDNLLGVVFYLRVINSIHDEIGDQLVSRSRAEQDRANTLKDLVRARDVQKIAGSWKDILSQWRTSSGTVAELSMKAIGKWVSWIDISLVVNQEMLQLLFQQLEQAQINGLSSEEEKARDCAVDVFTEIVAKKMPPMDKINMIAFLDVRSVVAKLSSCAILADCKTSIYDVDLAENVAKLVNTTVADIVRASESEQQSSDTWRKAEQMIRDFLPQLLRYFSDDYDEVCSTVLPATTDLLAYIRRAFSGEESASQRTVMLIPVLNAIFLKMRYDETAAYGDEEDNEFEAEFQELRKRLSALQQAIAAADEQLYIDAVSGLVNTTFEKMQDLGGQLNWRDLDLALYEMYLLGDLAVKSGGLYQKNKPNSPVAERLIRMMLLMVQSHTGSYDHPAIQTQYMEICVRYSTFFDKQAQYLQPVLKNFLQLAHSTNVKVRSRAWYLIQRITRQQRQHVGTAVEMFVSSLQDLLVVKAELPAPEDGDDSEDESSADSTFTNQLYLFEAVGCVISAGTVPAEKQVQYVQAVMQPIFSDIQVNLEPAKSSRQSTLQVHHDIMALGNIARGYLDAPGGNPAGSRVAIPDAVKDAFAKVSEVTLVALETLKASFEIRTGARFTFSRLIAIVGRQMIQQLPRWVDGFLIDSTSRDEMAQFLRLLDQVTFGFKNDISEFLDTIFTGLLQRVFAGISGPPSGTDDEIELAELKREYINFLLVVLSNDLGGILVSTRNQSFFETIIGTIEHFAKDAEDLNTAKMAFQLLSKMTTVWGGPDVVSSFGQQNGDPSGQNGADSLPGFQQFMMQRFSPLCWAFASSPAFNAKDGETRQVLFEAAGLQKMIYIKTGQEYLTYLSGTELPGIGLQGPMLEDFLSKLATLDMKTWKMWFSRFVSQAGNA